MSSCSLWINVARTDIPFMMQTIPHLVKMCRYPFIEKVLAVETAELSGDKPRRPGVGTMAELRECCRKLCEAGIMDRAIDIDYSKGVKKSVYGKHFGTGRIKTTHNWKGYPVYGMMYCIEMARSDHFLHFDSDMLLYQQPGFNWIKKGIDILRSNTEIFYVRPQSGPQGETDNLYLEKYKTQKDPNGFYRLDWFGSRCFLINRSRFEKILPMKVRWAKRQARIKDRMPKLMTEALCNLSGSGFLESWEIMVSDEMKRKGLLRADIADNKAWTLHPKDHGDNFIKALSHIIHKIENGKYPPQQLGKYDLELQYWL